MLGYIEGIIDVSMDVSIPFMSEEDEEVYVNGAAVEAVPLVVCDALNKASAKLVDAASNLFEAVPY